MFGSLGNDGEDADSRSCVYVIEDVRGFASDIRCASLFGSLRPGVFVHAINPSGIMSVL